MEIVRLFYVLGPKINSSWDDYYSVPRVRSKAGLTESTPADIRPLEIIPAKFYLHARKPSDFHAFRREYLQNPIPAKLETFLPEYLHARIPAELNTCKYEYLLP